MDLDQLATFIEVAELGNFSRAAEKVLRSQSAVSAQIRQLEDEYGEKLFDRTKKSVTLTPAGELLLDYARRIMSLRQESLRAVADSGADTRGVLSIGANETTFLYVLPEVLACYHRKYPNVRISVYRNFSHKVLQKVEDDVMELGVLTTPVRSSSMTVIPIFRDPLVWIVAADSPLAQRGTASLAELAQHEVILHKMGSLRRLMEKQLHPFKPRLRVTMELASAEMVKKFVAAGLGVSMISERFVQEELREGKVKILQTDGETTYRELAIVYHEGRSLSRAAKEFVTIAVDYSKRDARAAAK